MGRLTPQRLVIVSFLCAIIIGTIILSLPAATKGDGRLSIIDSLFTATSATCVTGLIVKDTGSYFSPLGKWTIFALFQIGGLGIMTFSTLFAVMLGRKIGFYETDVIRSTLDKHNILGLKKLILYIIAITLAAELVGACFLFLRWKGITDWSLGTIISQAMFHSVSGFCNAGFSLFQNSLVQFQSDPWINLTMSVLILFGGIGFIVIMDIIRVVRNKKPKHRLSLQSKIALSVSFILIIAGVVFLLAFEKDGVMKEMSWPQKIWGAVFQSITARTAGFNTLPINQLSIPSLIGLTFLMFIGASPGSTGGGIKTCTFAILAAIIYAMMKNKRRVMLFSRSIPKQIIRETIVIFFLAAVWIFVFTIILTCTQNAGGIENKGTFIKSFFEIVSAFGTVGLSTGITAGLNNAGKLCIIATMFAGRVGPLTLTLAVAFKKRKDNYVYPEETVMVG
ncbi:MAG: TrkH family potassium uptake protein [Candidatus Omnitrophota bacterium]